jgi:hypothetical protein
VNGELNKFSFGEIGSNKYRYMANSILNAGYLQMDNAFGEKFAWFGAAGSSILTTWLVA